MRVMVFVAQSIDGYIAKKDGDIQWLNDLSEKAAGEDQGFESIMELSDYLIMGRKSFEKVLSFDFWPYEGQKVIVLSKSLKELPETIKETTEIYAGDIENLYERLKNEGCQALYIDGAQTIQSFLHKELVTDMTITTVPILLGEGISLFGWMSESKEVDHEYTKAFPSGMVQTKYRLS